MISSEKDTADKHNIELKNSLEQITAELKSAKENDAANKENLDKVKEEFEKQLEDQKKLGAANEKSHQAELQNKLDVR